MPARGDFVGAVQALIEKPHKTLAGVESPMQWSPARDGIGVEAKIQIEVDGTQYGDKLSVVAVPSLGTFHINLIHRVGLCVSRLDFDPMQPHPNTMHAAQDGLPAMVTGKHFHRWSINTRFVNSDGTLERLFHAEELPASIHTFEQALRWFCSELNIDLPHGHSVDYPEELI